MHRSERAEHVSTLRDRADDARADDAQADDAELASLMRSSAATIESYGNALEEFDRWEESLYQIALELGFTAAGGGRREAILRVFWWVRENRKPVDSGSGHAVTET